MTTTRRLRLLLPGVISNPDPLSVGGLADSDISGETLVVGFVVIDSTGARLCAALAESLPPLCSGASVDLVDLENLELPLKEAQSVRWTDFAVVLRGLYADGTLSVTQVVGG